MTDNEQDGQEPKRWPEPGRTAKIATTVVILAILVPFIGILWAWAGAVIRVLGGLW